MIGLNALGFRSLAKRFHGRRVSIWLNTFETVVFRFLEQVRRIGMNSRRTVIELCQAVLESVPAGTWLPLDFSARLNFTGSIVYG